MTTRHIKRLPQNDKTNGWNLMLPARAPNRPLAGEVRADWLVLGAGYAGLAAARRLAEHHPDASIALVEAGVMGENASARNSGFGIDIPHMTGLSASQLEYAQSYSKLSRAAIGHLAEMVERYGIACDWSKAGKYQTCSSPRGRQAYLEPMAKMLDMLDEPHEWLDAPAIAARVGTGHYHAAIYTPGCILMNPAALTRGLAGNLPENVTLYENSPVVEFENSNGIRIRTRENARLFAPRMILATNAFSQEFGFFTGKLIPLYAHASLTRPLTEDEHRTYGELAPWGLTPANSFVSITMRYTPDRRILIRHDIDHCPSLTMSLEEQARQKASHQRLFHQRFPQLPDVTIEHTWTGFVCVSYNHAPGFAQLAHNVHAAVCQNAVGVTQGTISGILAADMACERDNPLLEDMARLGTPSWRPPRPFFDVGMAIRNAWHKWRERDEA